MGRLRSDNGWAHDIRMDFQVWQRLRFLRDHWQMDTGEVIAQLLAEAGWMRTHGDIIND